MHSSLREEDLKAVKRVLLDLLVRAEAEECLLCDSGGYVLAQEGPGARDPFLISALGAGVFGASRELARMLGEDEFSAVFHQGERRSIFIRAVSGDLLLVVVFTSSANVGLVKLYAAPAAQELQRVFQSAPQGVENGAGASFVLSQRPGHLFGSSSASR